MAVAQATNVARRRFVYGTNVLLQVVLVAAVVVLAIYFAQRFKGQIDMTRSGVNSLSPRTEKLLANLDTDVRVTALYTVISEYDERAQKRQDVVGDLLDLYELAGHGRVTANLIDPMKSPMQLPALLQRLREKPAYRDEAQAHEEALKGFPDLNEALMAQLAQDITAAETLAQSLQGEQQLLTQVLSGLQRLKRNAETMAENVTALLDADIPRYSQAVDEARRHLEAFTNFLDAIDEVVQQNAGPSANVNADVLSFLQELTAGYDSLRTDSKAFMEKTENLEELELEQLSNQLNRAVNAPPILVETDETAQLVPFNEVWPYRRDGAVAGGDEREFRGEQAISSAILALTQQEKTKVIYTRWGGPSPIVPDYSQMRNMRQPPRAPFEALDTLLQKENFLTADWDVKTQKEPPPLDEAARNVFVVLPPTPPQQTNPMQPPREAPISAEDVQLVLDQVKKSGKAIFLAGWTPPSSPMPGAPGGDYEYADYLRDEWGIDVLHDAIVLPFAQSPDDPSLHVPTPRTQAGIISGPALRLTDHPITEPLQASPAGLDATCPLEIMSDADRPEGVQADPLIMVRESDDIWAVTDLQQLNTDFRELMGTRRREGDIAPPFPLAVAASKDDQRLVVFASRTFVTNPMIEQPGGFAMTGAGLQAYPAYPANPDLMINALHWLTDNADRIAVGPQATDIPRLDKLKNDAWLSFWRVFLVAIWPALALLTGGGVWLFRRR